jgi:hypothetical protein
MKWRIAMVKILAITAIPVLYWRDTLPKLRQSFFMFFVYIYPKIICTF